MKSQGQIKVSVKPVSYGYQVRMGCDYIGEVYSTCEGYSMGGKTYENAEEAVAKLVMYERIEPSQIKLLYPDLSVLRITRDRYCCKNGDVWFDVYTMSNGWGDNKSNGWKNNRSDDIFESRWQAIHNYLSQK